MANAGNAIIYLEQGQEQVPAAALTNAGDRRTFNSDDVVWSRKIAPVVTPDGMVTGRNVGSPSATVDAVAVAAFSAYSGGVLRSVAANAAFVVTRPATNVAKIISVCMDSTGAIEQVGGTAAADETFVETRGAAGGPPVIPVGSVELFQVRTAVAAEGVFEASEISQVVGQHTERYDFPSWNISTIGKGKKAKVEGQDQAHVYFDSALPAIHTGGVTKGVYATYTLPVYGEMAKTLDFKAVETSHSVSSRQYYGGTIGSKSSSLGQGSFTALLRDGVNDSIIDAKDENLTVKYHPDRDKTAYIITQGTIGIDRSFPVGDEIQAEVTITAEEASVEFAG